LKLKEGEADLIAMQHVFKIEYPGSKPHTLKTSLIMIGEKHGASAMSVTVGYPTAVGAQLVLDGKVSLRGVIRPMERQIYEPVLEELAKEGIKLE
jgi:saccharopine dehydrogenase-like NADP-dependent oxidoreductase